MPTWLGKQPAKAGIVYKKKGKCSKTRIDFAALAKKNVGSTKPEPQGTCGCALQASCKQGELVKCDDQTPRKKCSIAPWFCLTTEENTINVIDKEIKPKLCKKDIEGLEEDTTKEKMEKWKGGDDICVEGRGRL